jgi:hypothetical protein
VELLGEKGGKNLIITLRKISTEPIVTARNIKLAE